jgi:hypothetical protein
MKPSEEIYETTTSTYWFEDDILYVISKKVSEPDHAMQIKEMEDFKKRIGGKKVYAIMDVSNASPSSKEARDRNAVELPKLFKAIAFIIKSPMARMLAHLYLGINPMKFEVKMCSNREEAKEWIDSLKATNL